MADNENILDVIYQFYDFETGIEKVLKDRTIRFSTPLSFNDPFDCHSELIDVSYEFNEEKYKDQQLLGFDEIENVVYNILMKKNHEIGYSFIKNSIRNSLRISCFSNCCDEILMWSHYANKHTGICVGYDVEKHNGGFFVRVEYPKDDKFESKPFIYGDFLVKDKNEIAIKQLIKYKSQKWKYEKEIRWAFQNNKIRALDKKQEINFQGKIDVRFEKLNISVKEIIFGLKVSSEKIKNKIKELQLYGYEHVKFYQMKEVPNEFRIEKELINTEDIF
ncbi:DUF2971 domain-containing protein [Wenyingzhuangia sp. 1_MG-2023]|nr:DUF2971 domain-containing protein [Wenyingzhuangia sp. 1_MG-2023]